MTLDTLIDRSYLIAVARGTIADSPGARTGYAAGARLMFALFLVRESARHADDIRDIEIDLDRLRERDPWLGAALKIAGATEHVEVV